MQFYRQNAPDIAKQKVPGSTAYSCQTAKQFINSQKQRMQLVLSFR